MPGGLPQADPSLQDFQDFNLQLEPRFQALVADLHTIVRRPIFPDFFRTFLGDFTPDRLDSRSLETLWEWKNRVILEEYYIFNVAIPPEVE